MAVPAGTVCHMKNVEDQESTDAATRSKPEEELTLGRVEEIDEEAAIDIKPITDTSTTAPVARRTAVPTAAGTETRKWAAAAVTVVLDWRDVAGGVNRREDEQDQDQDQDHEEESSVNEERTLKDDLKKLGTGKLSITPRGIPRSMSGSFFSRKSVFSRKARIDMDEKKREDANEQEEKRDEQQGTGDDDEGSDHDLGYLGTRSVACKAAEKSGNKFLQGLFRGCNDNKKRSGSGWFW